MAVIDNIEDVKKIIKQNNFKIFGVGAYPSTRSEIWPFVDDFEVICANPTNELEAIKKKVKVSVFKQTDSNEIAEKKPQMILSDERVVNYINNFKKNRKIALYFYKPSQIIDDLCKKNNWTVIANNAKLFEKYSNKFEFYKILEELKINRDIRIIKLDELENNLDELFKKWGKKIVAQFLDEGGGRGTFFFKESEKEKAIVCISKRLEIIGKKRTKNMKVVVSKFVKGPILSVTACITRDNGILTSYCQYQLIDIKEVIKGKRDSKGVFCGHDWVLSSEISDEINKKGQELAIKIGEKLQEKGLLGIFGLDFILDDKENIIPLEINPRLLGSFPASVYVQLEKKEASLVAFHLLEFLKIPYKIRDEKVYKKEKYRQGAHLIIFNPLNENVKCNKELKGGVYKLDSKNKMVWVRLGVELADIREKGEFVITEGAPIKGLVYKKNGKLLKIITKDSISVNFGKELNDWAKRIVNEIYKELDIFKKDED